jgi:hypothetical protein
MSIPYLNVSFTHVRADSGAPEFLSYLGRCPVLDTRLARRFDFSHLSGDLVHSEVVRTGDTAARFGEIEYLANSVDEAEVYRGNFDARSRRQNGVALVLALPPDSETTLSESVEFTRRIALTIAGNRSLAIHAAIHDPARMLPGARNRHGHLFYPRREIHYDEISGPAIRDMFAHPLRAAGKAVTVEGNQWPDWYQRRLLEFFAELGIDLVVDPIAPYPGRHSPAGTKVDDPRVQRARARTRCLNIDAIRGDPVSLINKLLRGRSAIWIAEVQRLIDRFVDNEGERRTRLEAILGHSNLETFAVLPTAKYPRLVTTVATRSSIQHACVLVDRAAIEPRTRTIHAVTALSHAKTIERLKDLLGRIEHSSRPLVLGNNHSECRALSQAIREAKPQVSTIKAALPNSDGSNKQLLIAKNRLIIIPRAESVNDQTLARLIVTANARNTRLVLMHDQSKPTGVVSHRLAAHAVDRLASLEQVQDENDVERYLRSGLIARGINSMAKRQEIEFKDTDRLFDKSASFDFLVCNDSRRLKDLNDKIRTLRIRRGELATSIKFGHPRKPVQLSPDEWIVFTRDDYSSCPPVIRRGELAQIKNIDSHKNQISVSLSTGECATIELERFTHFRPAHALLIREARNVDRQHRLLIDVSEVHHVWAATVLAAQMPHAALAVNPQIAKNISSLIAATAASLPAALPHQLALRRDPNAELAAIFRGEVAVAPLSPSLDIDAMPDPKAPEGAAIASLGGARSSTSTFEFETFPIPKPPRKIKSQPIAALHERVRALLDCTPHTRRGMDRLREKLQHDNPERDTNARHILQVCGDDSPLAAIVNTLWKPRSSIPTDPMAELDLPLEIEQLSPRAWDEWDLYRLKIDLSTLQWNFTRWEITPVEFRFPIRESWRRLFENGEMSPDEVRALSI